MEHAQRLAARAVRRVLSGSALPALLAAERWPAGGERALVAELAYGTLRHLGQVRGIVRALADRPLADASVEALLWVSLYQLLHTAAAPHAVVDAAVRATARLRKSSARSLTNAILRNFLRRRDVVLASIAGDDEARFSHPRWWIDRVRADFGEQAATILDNSNARAPLSLRVNARVNSRAAYLALLEAKGIAARAIGEAGIVLAAPMAITALPGYAQGAFSVQDAGAQLAAPLLGVKDGMRVLDACAAPGGKTTHLAELATLNLVAIDNDATRLERVAQNLARLGLRARIAVADAGAIGEWWDGSGFDRILLDVPCTASGVVRRHPDAKWLRRESDLAAFGEQQRRLLDNAWTCLLPGGRMLYATCSIFRAENSEPIAQFMAHHDDAIRLPLQLPPGFAVADGQLLPSGAGAEHNHDGFFYALLQKK